MPYYLLLVYDYRLEIRFCFVTQRLVILIAYTASYIIYNGCDVTTVVDLQPVCVGARGYQHRWAKRITEEHYLQGDLEKKNSATTHDVHKECCFNCSNTAYGTPLVAHTAQRTIILIA